MAQTIKHPERCLNAINRLPFEKLCGNLSVRINDSYYHLLIYRCQGYQSQGTSQFPFRRKLSIGLIEDVDSLKESTGVVRNSLPKRTGTHPISIRYQEHSLNTVPLGYLCPKNLNPKHITNYRI